MLPLGEKGRKSEEEKTKMLCEKTGSHSTKQVGSFFVEPHHQCGEVGGGYAGNAACLPQV